MDEPTAALSGNETAALHEIIGPWRVMASPSF